VRTYRSFSASEPTAARLAVMFTYGELIGVDVAMAREMIRSLRDAFVEARFRAAS
jgi:hypothetical protein